MIKKKKSKLQKKWKKLPKWIDLGTEGEKGATVQAPKLTSNPGGGGGSSQFCKSNQDVCKVPGSLLQNS